MIKNFEQKIKREKLCVIFTKNCLKLYFLIYKMEEKLKIFE